MISKQPRNHLKKLDAISKGTTKHEEHRFIAENGKSIEILVRIRVCLCVCIL